MATNSGNTTPKPIDEEISDLEHRLQESKRHKQASLDTTDQVSQISDGRPHLAFPSQPVTHNLLLLSDSALPLGSFAFSSGLESYLAHLPNRSANQNVNHFDRFLSISISSLATSSLPYVRATFERPLCLEKLDDELDASTPCGVAKRASIAQGKALVAIWERSFRKHYISPAQIGALPGSAAATQSLDQYSKCLKASHLYKENTSDGSNQVHGHLAPLFGVLGAALSLPLELVLYLFLLNHAKTLLSAAVRANLFGPFHAQSNMAAPALKDHIQDLVSHDVAERNAPGDAGQCAPLLDLWGGRHDILYSRIFNS